MSSTLTHPMACANHARTTEAAPKGVEEEQARKTWTLRRHKETAHMPHGANLKP